jgi:ribosomal protein S18 acetylase RimI-like enzyme
VPAAVKLSPYLWTHQYTLLSPATCHVLDDGAGTAVGYCIGCADVFAFTAPASYDRYVATVLDDAAHGIARPADITQTREPWSIPNTSAEDGGDNSTTVVNPVAMAQTAYNPSWLVLAGNEHLTARHRATMHIDMLPPYQGQGWGRQLIDRFVASVRASGQDYGDGLWIGIAGENTKVVRFYEKVGFRVVEKPAAPATGGEADGVNMVRDIPKEA